MLPYLAHATSQTHLDVVLLLLEHDAPVDMIALQCAVDAEDDEVMNLLAGLLEALLIPHLLWLSSLNSAAETPHFKTSRLMTA